MHILKVILPQCVLLKCNNKKQTYTTHIQDFQVTSFSFVHDLSLLRAAQ